MSSQMTTSVPNDILDLLGEGVIVARGDTFVSANKAAVEMFGEDLIGKQLLEVVPKLVSGARFQPAGSDATLEVVAVEPTDTATIVVISDVTKLVDLNESMIRLSRELRTSLDSALGFAEITHSDANPTSGDIEAIDRISWVLSDLDGQLSDAFDGEALGSSPPPADPIVSAISPAQRAAAPDVRVLQVDSNELSARLVERIVAGIEGMSVVTVTNVADALAAMAMGLPDIVVLDRHLPDGWGDDVLGVVRAHPSGMDLPVLMLTADAVETSVSRLLELGATQVLTKPTSAARLKAELMLAMRSLPQANPAPPRVSSPDHRSPVV